MRWGMVSASARLKLVVAARRFGTTGVAISYVICMYFLFLPSIAYFGRHWGIGLAQITRVIRGPVASSLLA